MKVQNGNSKTCLSVRSNSVSRSSRAMGLALGLALLLPLSGCGSVGMIASKSESFEFTDSVVLRSRPSNFVAAVETIAPPLKFQIGGLDRAQNKVTLSDSSSLATGVLIGKMKQIRMDVALGGDGRTVSIQVYALGNFGTADREKVEKRVSDFKAALVAQAK